MTHIPDEAVQAALDKWNSAPITVDESSKRKVMHASISAALPHLSAPCAVEVKGLEWSTPSSPNKNCSYDHVCADTHIGKYQIEWKSWKDYDAYAIYLEGNLIESEFDLPEAKAAAQADFERRILSCVVTKPVDVAAVRDAFKLGWQSSETANVEDTWEDTFAYHFTDDHEILTLSAEPAQGEQSGRAALAQGGE